MHRIAALPRSRIKTYRAANRRASGFTKLPAFLEDVQKNHSLQQLLHAR